MLRRVIAFFIVCYAIAFAFAAMAAIRWPSLMLIADLIMQNNIAADAETIDWRLFGITYGAPYFIASVFLYISALQLTKQKALSLISYLTGILIAFPNVFIVEFPSEWWRDPSTAEGAITGFAAIAALLGGAIWLLRPGQKFAPHPRRSRYHGLNSRPGTSVASGKPASNPPISDGTKPRRKSLPPAIALQRAILAADGRRDRR